MTEQAGNAQWIWLGEPPEEQENLYVFFRGVFELDAVPEAACLSISAETRYRLRLNGEYLGEGPPPSMPGRQFLDGREVAAHLRAGRNVIAAVVHFTVPHWMKTRPGLIAELRDGAGAVLAASDARWRCRVADCWQRDTWRFRMNCYDPWQEQFDQRRWPDGWDLPEFDDGDWATAAAVEDPTWTLVPRDIPFMAEEVRFPARVERVEECTWLDTRTRDNDLSVELAQVGLPVQFSQARDVEALVDGKGPATLCCSTNHLEDRTFDGVREPAIVLDLGREYTAWVELDVEGPAGARIEFGLAERLLDGQFNNSIEGQLCSRYSLDQGRRTFRCFSWRGFRYIKLRVRQCFEPLTLHAVRAVVTRYPFEQRGAFEAPDEVLSGVFDMCRHTLQLCCHESIMDTPQREQAQWLGDVAAVTLGGVYACFGDTELAAKFLRQSAASQRPDGLLQNITNRQAAPDARCIPDYSLWWIHGLWNHYLYTGDRALLEQLWPIARGIVDRFAEFLDEDGLISNMPGWIFIDWANVGKRGRCAALNALFAGTLDVAVQIRRTLDDRQRPREKNGGRGSCRAAGPAFPHAHDPVSEGGTYDKASSDEVSGLSKMADRLRASSTDAFLDPDTGLFADNSADGEHSTMRSEHANAAAILYGLCDAAQTANLIRAIWVDKRVEVVETEPFFCGAVVLPALTRAGRFDLALELIRARWGERMWRKGTGSCHEEWGMNGSFRNGPFKGFMRTTSHAWSAGPAEFLIRELPGIRVLEPGCRKVGLAPQKTDFDWSITYPTPLGELRVRWADGKLETSAPAEMAIESE